MAESSQATTALLTEHLQYTPLSLIDDVINSVNSLVYQGIASLENGLFSTPPDRLGFKAIPAAEVLPGAHSAAEPEYPDAKKEIEEGLHQLETLLESTVDRNFDKFEIYVLRNILSVPEDLTGWIRLNHYENLVYPPAADAPTPESVQLLRRKVAASRNVRNALLAEQARNQGIMAQLQSLLQSGSQGESSINDLQNSAAPNFSFLTSTPSAQAYDISTSNSTQQPLATNTKFALSQLPALRALLADLRPKLASLHSDDGGVETASDERREERKEYIERRTGIYLVKDSNSLTAEKAIVTGRSIDREEVQALEKIASTFDST